MTKEVWTIVGVVIGAMLAGGGQILAGTLQRKAERENIQREHQRVVYVDWLRHLELVERLIYDFKEVVEARVAVHEYKKVIDAWRSGDREGQQESALDGVRAGLGLSWGSIRFLRRFRRLMKVHDAQEHANTRGPTLAALRLVAPEDTYEAAAQTVRTRRHLVSYDPEVPSLEGRPEALRAYNAATSEFLRLAKRDLGIAE